MTKGLWILEYPTPADITNPRRLRRLNIKRAEAALAEAEKSLADGKKGAAELVFRAKQNLKSARKPLR